MGLLSLPVMLRRGYSPAITTGTICAAGTLGQIIPPSIVLVLLGDVLSSAYQQAQISQGIFSPDTVSVGDLFAGALLPGLLVYIWWFGWGPLTNLVYAVGSAVLFEALLLTIRRRPLWPFLSDGSAVLTACLLALSLLGGGARARERTPLFACRPPPRLRSPLALSRRRR